MPEERTVKLINGHTMPLLGLGCWQSPVDEVSAAVEAALECGYRHIDTAYNYLNEEGVGQGLHNWLQKSKVKRNEIFVVSKLPMIAMHEGGVEIYLRKSLEKLKLSYLDLYLIHCPIGMKGSHDRDTFPKDSDGKFMVDHATDLIAIWKEMEKMVDAGLIKSIGISNFSMKQIRKICAIARIPPAVHQVEMHVEFQQVEMHKFCQANNIIMTAYAPLGSPGRQAMGRSIPELLKNPVVKLVADNHKVTTAQVLVRYWIQRGVTVIPKSVNKQRIVTNGDVWSFKLSEVEMDALLTLDKGEDGRSFDFLTIFPGFSDHPECPRRFGSWSKFKQSPILCHVESGDPEKSKRNNTENHVDKQLPTQMQEKNNNHKQITVTDTECQEVNLIKTTQEMNINDKLMSNDKQENIRKTSFTIEADFHHRDISQVLNIKTKEKDQENLVYIDQMSSQNQMDPKKQTKDTESQDLIILNPLKLDGENMVNGDHLDGQGQLDANNQKGEKEMDTLTVDKPGMNSDTEDEIITM